MLLFQQWPPIKNSAAALFSERNFGLAHPDAQASHEFISTVAEIVCAARSNNPISLPWTCRLLPCLRLKYAINLAQIQNTFMVLVGPRKRPCAAAAESQGAPAMGFVCLVDPPSVVGFPNRDKVVRKADAKITTAIHFVGSNGHQASPRS